MASNKRKSLGKGLEALIRPQSLDDEGAAEGRHRRERLLQLSPGDIEANPKQPRRHFDEEALQELAASLKQHGVQEPVIVRQRGDAYELISGERRVRAAVMADIETIPAICREVSDDDLLKLGLIENIQREDLNAIELAQAYRKLMDESGWTQEHMADEVGKKRATVANTLRLLQLPEDVQDEVAQGRLSMGHARALLALDSVERQRAACRKVLREGLSVRQTEKLAAQKSSPDVARREPPKREPSLVAVEDELRRRLGTKVAVKASGPAQGKIEIEYYSFDDLDRFLDLLRGRN